MDSAHPTDPTPSDADSSSSSSSSSPDRGPAAAGASAEPELPREELDAAGSPESSSSPAATSAVEPTAGDKAQNALSALEPSDQIIWLDVGTVRPHPLHSEIYEERDEPKFEQHVLRGLADRTLEPGTVTPQRLIISGSRRWTVARKHGQSMIPFIVRKFDNDALAIVLANQQRQKTTGERLREAEVLKRELARKAMDRRKGRGKKVEPDLAPLSKDERSTSGQLAKAVGMSRGSYNKARHVVDSDKAPEDLKEKMNRDQVSVDKAYRDTRALEKNQQPEKDDDVATPEPVSTPMKRLPPRVKIGNCIDKLKNGIAWEDLEVVILDPPRMLPRGEKPKKGKFNALEEQEWHALLDGVLGHLDDHLDQRTSVYVFADRKSLQRWTTLVKETRDLKIAAHLIWHDSDPTPARKPGWANSWSWILYIIRKKAAAPIWTMHPDVAVPDVIGVPRREGAPPDAKPVDLLEHLIEVSSNPGGLVLDPFAGTGSTGVAAWRMGRRSVLIERDPALVDSIKKTPRGPSGLFALGPFLHDELQNVGGLAIAFPRDQAVGQRDRGPRPVSRTALPDGYVGISIGALVVLPHPPFFGPTIGCGGRDVRAWVLADEPVGELVGGLVLPAIVHVVQALSVEPSPGVDATADLCRPPVLERHVERHAALDRSDDLPCPARVQGSLPRRRPGQQFPGIGARLLRISAHTPSILGQLMEGFEIFSTPFIACIDRGLEDLTPPSPPPRDFGGLPSASRMSAKLSGGLRGERAMRRERGDLLQHRQSLFLRHPCCAPEFVERLGAPVACLLRYRHTEEVAGAVLTGILREAGKFEGDVSSQRGVRGPRHDLVHDPSSFVEVSLSADGLQVHEKFFGRDGEKLLGWLVHADDEVTSL